MLNEIGLYYPEVYYMNTGTGRVKMKKTLLLLLILTSVIPVLSEDDSRGIIIKKTERIDRIQGNDGKRYAICIGINNYEDPVIPDLNKARNDAKGLGKELKKYGQFDTIFMMTDDIDPRYDEMHNYPRLKNIRARLDYLKEFIKPDDLVLISFSGHGLSNEYDEGFLLVTDTELINPFKTSLKVNEIVNWLKTMKVKKSLLLIDACREKVSVGTSRGLLDKKSLKTQKYNMAELSAIFYATKTGWKSYEVDDFEYGLFTNFILEGIKGKADYQFGNSDGIVTFKELSNFTGESVCNFALNHVPVFRQKPYTKIYNETFGDLAISTYSGVINRDSKDIWDNARAEKIDRGFGEMQLYSNVPGEIWLDSKKHGNIDRGETIILSKINTGRHFLEVHHGYGVYRNEFLIGKNKQTVINNIVIIHEKDITLLNGINLIYIKGNSKIKSFFISESEICFGQFNEFVEETGYESKNNWKKFYRQNYDYYPVHNVSKEDCLAFVKWLSKKTGKNVDLPEIRQWQYAAGGKINTDYPWGNIWNSMYCHNKKSNTRGMLPVIGSLGPIQVQFFLKDITIDGVANLSGNVREWCKDEKKSNEGFKLSAIVGGSWKWDKPKFFKNTYVIYNPVHIIAEDLGFRIVVTE